MAHLHLPRRLLYLEVWFVSWWEIRNTMILSQSVSVSLVKLVCGCDKHQAMLDWKSALRPGWIRLIDWLVGRVDEILDLPSLARRFFASIDFRLFSPLVAFLTVRGVPSSTWAQIPCSSKTHQSRFTNPPTSRLRPPSLQVSRERRCE